jgi:DNA-binding NarL/FixJ family response regulator
MKVLLVDDHLLFLEALQDLLAARGIEVAGTARDGLDALAQARALRPDVILMDIGMPRCDGLAATRAIKAELPDVKIVMLTVSAEDEDLFEAIKSGASGYLLKSLGANQFFELLSDLERGEVALSNGMAARVLEEFARQAGRAEPATEVGEEDTPGLTPRQREVLTLVARGLKYKEVAAALCLSESTIKYHMGEILDRLHLNNRAQAIAYAARSGLAEGNLNR